MRPGVPRVTRVTVAAVRIGLLRARNGVYEGESRFAVRKPCTGTSSVDAQILRQCRPTRMRMPTDGVGSDTELAVAGLGLRDWRQ